MTTAEKLVSLRKEKGLSQLQLAEEINVSRQAISRWEVGLAVPSREKLRALSELYGYTMGNATTEDSSEIRDLDFYSAIGVNGKKGYIRASEMNGPKTLDEAATYDDSSKDIPVYASDGVTVIDTFHIYGPEESSSTDTMVAATSLTE